ncbi:hypothetical protein RhiirA4_425182 [Rhizophagus irregularis]|uniref:Crinkler effector protein N-terminal domain-containing protein n=1 Tax=Rhizophagus irregularis TaxID=588596 RepID=A0A2I1H0G1_9GLOM|nr:hypothetical protein RhiirA4_425182 [Rhizophagus irregularis]
MTQIDIFESQERIKSRDEAIALLEKQLLDNDCEIGRLKDQLTEYSCEINRLKNEIARRDDEIRNLLRKIFYLEVSLIEFFGNEVLESEEITLTCRLFRDIEANSKNFEIRVLTSETIDKLEDRVFAKLKEKKGDTFTDIEAYNLNLWKVNIPNDNEKKFSTLVLKNDDKGDIKILRSDYWEEQPPNECTHVIIDSPYLTTLRKLKALTTGDPGENEENYDLNISYVENIDKSNRSQNNDIKTELKAAKGIKIDKSLRTSTLSVALIDDKNEKMVISDWKTLENWLLNQVKKFMPYRYINMLGRLRGSFNNYIRICCLFFHKINAQQQDRDPRSQLPCFILWKLEVGTAHM